MLSRDIFKYIKGYLKASSLGFQSASKYYRSLEQTLILLWKLFRDFLCQIFMKLFNFWQWKLLKKFKKSRLINASTNQSMHTWLHALGALYSLHCIANIWRSFVSLYLWETNLKSSSNSELSLMEIVYYDSFSVFHILSYIIDCNDDLDNMIGESC